MTATDAGHAAGVTDDFDELAGAVDRARAAVDALPDDAATAARDLQAAIEAFHRPALIHLVRTLRADPRGKELLFELVDDPAVRAVFALHGIIRADPLTRANAALEAIRPQLRSHGGDVELVELDGDTAVVRLLGSCNGCSMSAVTLREGVEDALVNGVEEITAIRVLEDQPTTAFIPLESVSRRTPAESGWVPGPNAAELDQGSLTRIEVGGDDLVVANIDGRLGVFRNRCVHQGLSLDGGRLDDGMLTCPWHGFTFDAVTGECLSAPGAQLEQVPARVDGGVLWLRAGHG